MSELDYGAEYGNEEPLIGENGGVHKITRELNEESKAKVQRMK